MIYNVFRGTYNLALSIYLSAKLRRPCASCSLSVLYFYFHFIIGEHSIEWHSEHQCQWRRVSMEVHGPFWASWAPCCAGLLSCRCWWPSQTETTTALSAPCWDRSTCLDVTISTQISCHFSLKRFSHANRRQYESRLRFMIHDYVHVINFLLFLLLLLLIIMTKLHVQLLTIRIK